MHVEESGIVGRCGNHFERNSQHPHTSSASNRFFAVVQAFLNVLDGQRPKCRDAAALSAALMVRAPGQIGNLDMLFGQYLVHTPLTRSCGSGVGLLKASAVPSLGTDQRHRLLQTVSRWWDALPGTEYPLTNT